MLDPPGIAVGEAYFSIDAEERLMRHERAALPADPVYTLMIGDFRIERRGDGSAWLWLNDEHVLELIAEGADRLVYPRRSEAENWCLTLLLFVHVPITPDRIGEPLGALPDALADYLYRADAPARDRAADLAAHLLGRSIVPYHGQTRSARISGRLRLSTEGRQRLLNAVAAYYAHLRGLDRPAAAR